MQKRIEPHQSSNEYQTSNHHKDLSLSRIQRDYQNVEKKFEFLAERNPFHIDTVLINPNSGEVADESVNVFQAQAKGESLVQGIAGTSAFDYTFRKKDIAIIIKTNAPVNIEDNIVEVDPWLFFQSLIVFIRLEEINDASSYELCIRPSSWDYGTVENITVIFDGGYLVPSTKGSKHIRRSKGRLGRKIVPSLHNPLTVKKGDFLLHRHNRQAFFEMLGTQLSDGVADVDTVFSAITVTNTCPVTLLGEDTNLLILLLWHYNLSLHHPVHLYSNSSKMAVESRSPSSYSVMS